MINDTHSPTEKPGNGTGTGLQDALQQHLLVVGLARNCGAQLGRDIAALAGVLERFRKVSWLVIESDSDDDTVQQLEKLAAGMQNFRFLSLGRLREQKPLRADRIASCRNRYLDELRSNPLYADASYLVVADLDNMNNLLTQQAFLSCWERHDWDVCAANQRGPYYDIWALRHALWSPNDCWAQYRFLVANGLAPEQALFTAVQSRMIRIDESRAWIEVDSAFSGLAIYRRDALGEDGYVGLTADGEEVCEHVALHRALRARGQRIYINPALVNTGVTEHTRVLFWPARLKRRMKGLLGPLLSWLRRIRA
ncbi:MAG: hypothetical protein ACOY41_03895 [Pseudomonadota bacterium]